MGDAFHPWLSQRVAMGGRGRAALVDVLGDWLESHLGFLFLMGLGTINRGPARGQHG